MPEILLMEAVSSNYLGDDSIVDVPDTDGLVPSANPADSLPGHSLRGNIQRNHGPWDGSGDALAHCHPALSVPNDSGPIRTLSIVAAMTLLFIIFEFVGGTLADSLAIRTDAAHMLSDFLSFLISIASVYIARFPATRAYSFGWYRAEILGALVSIMIIWVLTGVLVYMAVLRCYHQNFQIEVDYMLGTAVAGVVFNILMGAVLHFSGHGHSHGLGGGHGHSHGGGHGHSHGESGHGHAHARPQVFGETEPIRRTRTVSVSAYPTEEIVHVNRRRNINVHAALVHVLGDLVQSIGVLIAALIIKFAGENYKLADPICTFIFSILVIITTLTVLRDALRVLMEGVPRDVDYQAVRRDLERLPGVKAAHSLHMWSLTLDKAALAVHLATDNGIEPLAVQRKAEAMMRYQYNVAFTTIQVEPWQPDVMQACRTCIGPLK